MKKLLDKHNTLYYNFFAIKTRKGKKIMKKFFAILMSLALMLSLAVPAMAEGEDGNTPATPATYTITINNTVTGYTYEAYQIFTGDLSEQDNSDAANGTNAKLSNIVWGSGVDQTGLIADLKELDFMRDLADAATAADVAEKLNGLAYNSDAAKQFAEVISKHLSSVKATSTENKKTEGDKVVTEKYTISSLNAGYYLVKNTVVPAGGSYTEYIVEVVENSTVSPKGNVPQFEKKVKDINDTTGVTTDWQDSADHDIGDHVPFQLKATLAENVTAYDTYKVIFHDTLSKGLTYDEGSYKVYLVDGDNRNEITGSFAINVGAYDKANGTKITFTCNDVTADPVNAGNKAVIVVEYTATLNTDAVIGSVGNPNVAELEFSNNPNWKPSEGTEPTGKTPEDKVIVFTYKTIVNKVDEKQEALAGATFELYKKDATGEWNLIETMVLNEDQTTFSWTGLDDGEYKLHESVTPAGYNTVADITFTITATHDEKATEPKLLTLTVNNTDFTVDAVTGETGTTYSGEISTKVVNNSGTTLPETGGMGTTIFYAVGGVMVAAAAILLVTKKRMSNNA